MDNQQVTLTQFELGWLIGIIDGEGSFTICKGKRKYSPSIKLVNTNREIINEITRLLEKVGIKYSLYDSWRSGNQKPAWRVEINTIEMLKKFFDIFYEYFSCRIEQATLLRDLVEHRYKHFGEPYTSYEANCYLILRQLNS